MASMQLEPAFAAVRPRVVVAGGSVPRLLEEEVAELLAAGERVTVHLAGPPGSGRTTALRHLAAHFSGEPRLGLRDDDGSGHDGALVTVTAMMTPRRPGAPVLTLARWSDDDVLEYLLRLPRATATTVFASWQQCSFRGDLAPRPALCRAVLDELTAGRSTDAFAALRAVLDRCLAPAERDHARETAFVACTRAKRRAAALPGLDAPIVRGMLAAEASLAMLANGGSLPLRLLQWPPELVAALRLLLAMEPQHEAMLVALFALGGEPHELPRVRERQAAALSVLCAARPAFRPPLPRLVVVAHVRLVGADLHGLELRGCLDHADLTAADLRCADLQGMLVRHARLQRARLDAAHLDHLQARRLAGDDLVATRASLHSCNLMRADLRRAVFDGAILTDAELGGARLDGASLREADLRRARLGEAHLDGADLTAASGDGANFAATDLRTARLAQATFRGADFEGADLTEQELPRLEAPGANFRRAWLTGTRWQGANLAGSTFAEAGLAGVDWEGADLRHCDFTAAAFHLGSSRSGLVPGGLPGAGASEGTRTGFYTDESLEDRFQAPEDVRKANLRGSDLRGARVGNCDFYLVDLRGALLDDTQRDWLRRCRAILDP